MPATTPNLNIPYPIDSDPLRSFPQVAKDAATIIDTQQSLSTAVLPVIEGSWRHDPDGGMVRTIGGTHYLNISIFRTGPGFHMNPGGIIDLYRVNNLVKVPNTREWVICGSLFGPDIWPMPVFLNNGLVRVLCYGHVDIKQNQVYRGSAVWVA